MPEFVITQLHHVASASADDAVRDVERGGGTLIESTATVPPSVCEQTDWRQCDHCLRVEDAGAYPDWVNGLCGDCDPTLPTRPTLA